MPRRSIYKDFISAKPPFFPTRRGEFVHLVGISDAEVWTLVCDRGVFYEFKPLESAETVDCLPCVAGVAVDDLAVWWEKEA